MAGLKEERAKLITYLRRKKWGNDTLYKNMTIVSLRAVASRLVSKKVTKKKASVTKKKASATKKKKAATKKKASATKKKASKNASAKKKASATKKKASATKKKSHKTITQRYGHPRSIGRARYRGRWYRAVEKNGEFRWKMEPKGKPGRPKQTNKMNWV